MNVGINSVVQALLNVDLGQFSESLFALGEREEDPESRTGGDTDYSDDFEDDESVANECCCTCRKLGSSPNKYAVRRIKDWQSVLRASQRLYL
jgi:hypothetical protein